MLRRLPRYLYWIIGAAIAFLGAFIARGLADQVPGQAKIPFWIGGSVVIFVGLWVLCLGTRSRLSNDTPDSPPSDTRAPDGHPDQGPDATKKVDRRIPG